MIHDLSGNGHHGNLYAATWETLDGKVVEDGRIVASSTPIADPGNVKVLTGNWQLQGKALLSTNAGQFRVPVDVDDEFRVALTAERKGTSAGGLIVALPIGDRWAKMVVDVRRAAAWMTSTGRPLPTTRPRSLVRSCRRAGRSSWSWKSLRGGFTSRPTTRRSSTSAEIERV